MALRGNPRSTIPLGAGAAESSVAAITGAVFKGNTRTKGLGFLTAALEEYSPGASGVRLAGHRHARLVPLPLPGAERLISESFRANSSKPSASRAPSPLPQAAALSRELPEPKPQRRPPPRPHHTRHRRSTPDRDPLATSPPGPEGTVPFLPLRAQHSIRHVWAFNPINERCSQKTSLICTR